MLATIFSIVVVLAVLAIAYVVIMWALRQFPLPAPIPQVVNIIAVLILLGVILLYVLPRVLSLFGASI